MEAIQRKSTSRRPKSAKAASRSVSQTDSNSELETEHIEAVQEANKVKHEIQKRSNSLNGCTANKSVTPLEPESSKVTRITELTNSKDSGIGDPGEVGIGDPGEVGIVLSKLSENEEKDLWTLPAHPVLPESNLNYFKSPDKNLNIEEMDRKLLKNIIAVSI